MRRKRMGDSASGNSFMSGVLVLSLSTLIVKIIGLAYKIPMIAYLGAEGMGYFNSAVEIYAMLCVISTAGLPVALSMLISAHRERGAFGEARRIYRVALGVFLVFGAVGSGLMLAFARPLAAAIGNREAFLCIIAIAPALFFVCFSGAVRGYFQGLRRMVPTAVSQLIEALGKLIFGVGFAALALRRGMDIPIVAAWAILGLSFGCALSALYLLLLKVLEKKWEFSRDDLPSCGESNLRALLRIAIPITLSSAVLSVTRLVDMALIMRRLQSIGVSAAEANRIFGAYTTLAIPVFGLIPSLITPIALALVPQLSAAIEGGKREDQAAVSDRAIRLTVLLSMPAAMGISVYASPILSILFRNEPESVATAAPLLSLLGGSVLFSGLITTTNGILQSYRKTWKPILSMAIGAVVKILFAYALIGIPEIGVMGAPISTFLCDVTVTVLNLKYMSSCVPRSKGTAGRGQTYGKPLLASVVSIAASLSVYAPMERMMGGEALSFLCAASVAVLVYGALALLLRIVTEEDLSAFPLVGRFLSRQGLSKEMKNRRTINKKEKEKV